MGEKHMKYVGIGMIWIAWAIAVVGMAYASSGGFATVLGIFGAFCVAVVSRFIVEEKKSGN